MNTHVIPASLRAFEDAAETAHVSGHGFFKQPLGGAHNTTVSYHSYPNAAEPAKRALLLENNAGCLRTSFLDQHPSWSNMSYSTGPGTPVSMTKRFERFVQFLKDDEAAMRESVFIDCAPRCAVEDLSHEHQARIAASLSAFGFSPAFKARFGYELLALAEEHANVTEIDAQAKRKAAETRRRRAEFKTVPGGALFRVKGNWRYTYARKRPDDDGSIDMFYGKTGTAFPVKATSNLVKQLELANFATIKEFKFLSAHERMTGLAAAVEAARTCPRLAAGPSTH
jgi:hypothetical protein